MAEPSQSAQASLDAPLTAEPDGWDDNDSSIDVTSLASSTTSITDTIRKHREENGRTYHKYKEEMQLTPFWFKTSITWEQIEQDRLDLQHQMFYITFGEKLFLSPAGQNQQLHRVLDAGTGTGIWAIDFGKSSTDEHPETEVLGIDLSPIQPSFIPANLAFQIDDLEENWNFSSKFDFIYTRMLTGSFTNWPRFFEQSFANLNPGGYIELADSCFPMRTDDNSFPPDSALKKWCDLLTEGCAAAGRPIDSAKHYKSQLEAAGFENVVEVQYRWPMGRWPKDKKAKELGTWGLANVYGGLESICLAVFTRVLGWTKEEIDVFLIDVRKELKDPKIHSYGPIYVVYGQKPVEK
ncbi:S-adenosyl-L-methionine-dependent methyltransferase-16 [Coleophoma crateriformis]|uniref:S-adenosyl-L-methionine-dependent methyltransferase-16 n=1 Tax=Coleophoma crateriformis TaxID=565419 RepID=A0A3D8QIU0_9HELO|nr:S-adenosyl-L-methionine-dependent methyltransferase-16 [Coleophoma crateriformis]